MIGYRTMWIANPYLGTDLANPVENHPSPDILHTYTVRRVDAHAKDVVWIYICNSYFSCLVIKYVHNIYYSKPLLVFSGLHHK